MLDYKEGFRQIADAKQGFYSPRAEAYKLQLDSKFAEDPIAFRNQNNAEGRLANKAKKRATPIGEAPKFRSSKEQVPVIYEGN
jgi:hypothetical protein